MPTRAAVFASKGPNKAEIAFFPNSRLRPANLSTLNPRKSKMITMMKPVL